MFKAGAGVRVFGAVLMGVLGLGVEAAQADEVVLRETPCRLYDSRNVGGIGMGNKVNSSTGTTIETHSNLLSATAFTSGGVDFNNQGGEAGCGVPASATGAIINLLVFQPESGGWARIWAYGSPEPLATSINVTVGAASETTGLMVRTGTGGQISLSALISNAHYVIDLAGYTESCETVETFDLHYNEQLSKIYVSTTDATDLAQFGPAGRKIRIGGDASQPGLYTITSVSVNGKQLGIDPAPQSATDEALEVHLLSGDCSPRAVPVNGAN